VITTEGAGVVLGRLLQASPAKQKEGNQTVISDDDTGGYSGIVTSSQRSLLGKDVVRLYGAVATRADS
jgi:hypothetical protein